MKPLIENLREDPRRHIVQFYRDDTQLLETVARSIGGTLAAGGAAIVLATPARREMLAEHLAGQGLDVAGAMQEGRYVGEDAAETLATFMVDGWPDRARFQEVIGTIVMRTAMAGRCEHPRLVAFGEMVAVLWERGQARAALELEHLWNELLEKHSFTLYCGYPMSAFSETSDTEPFHAVCAAHSSVIPATDENGEVFSQDNYQRALATVQQAAQALQNEKTLRRNAQQAQEVLRENRDALKKEVEERMAAEARLQDSETSLRILSRNLFHVQDEERRHLGRELHDTIGQYLSALKMELNSLQFEPALQDRGVRQQLEGSIGLVEQCIKEVRTMSYLLYPPLLEEMGLKMAIPWYVDGFAKRSGIQTRLQMSRDFVRLPRNVELVLFRVLQECLTNVHRHSGSPTALIRVFVENEVAVIEIIDAGKGLPTGVLDFDHRGSFSVGIGLRGMSERVKGVGGKLELSSAGNGTTVRVSVPSSRAQVEDARAIH